MQSKNAVKIETKRQADGYWYVRARGDWLSIRRGYYLVPLHGTYAFIGGDHPRMFDPVSGQVGYRSRGQARLAIKAFTRRTGIKLVGGLH